MSSITVSRSYYKLFMQYLISGDELVEMVNQNLDEPTKAWFSNSLETIVQDHSVKPLYLTYSLCSSKIAKKPLSEVLAPDTPLKEYLLLKEANLLELARICLLAKVLEADTAFFEEKVKKLIQIADKEELETFLRFLVVLPNPEAYCSVAVEALRTNIATVFDAIVMNNPYPSRYFNEQQWNQMYLKAAFMQRDLTAIHDIEKRANKVLARIVSDYAHERWAASREIDPHIWQPISNFLEGQLIDDIIRLFQSDNVIENKAAALVCWHSDLAMAAQLLNEYPTFHQAIENGDLTWSNLKH